jgi:hypothetical protein
VISVYFTLISRNWFGLFLSTSILGAVGNVIMLFMPECPGWLLQHGRKKDAIIALNQIAKINGSKTKIPFDIVFLEEQSQR